MGIGFWNFPILDVAGACVVKFNRIDEMRSSRNGLDVVIKPFR